MREYIGNPNNPNIHYVGNPKDPPHRKWVGEGWEIVPAIILKTLVLDYGMRQNHKLLDIGCGSLRAGRVLISILNPNNYYGVEREKWVVEDGIQHELGTDLYDIKKPSFHYTSECDYKIFKTKFDYIIANAVINHSGTKWTKECIKEVSEVLKDDGVFLATLTLADHEEDYKTPEEVIYPDGVRYKLSWLQETAKEFGLVCDVSTETDNNWIEFRKVTT